MNILDYVKIETSTVEDGNMAISYGEKEEVIENRKNFFKEKGFEYDNTYLLRTDFKDFMVLDNVEVVNNPPNQFSVSDKTDALVTDNKDVVLALLTADCLQITIYDPIQKTVGLIHAGFKWQDAGIIDKTFKIMQEKFSTKAENVLIHLGNCISVNHYRWDKNIFKNSTEDSWVRRCLTKDNYPERPYIIDLRKSAILNLKDLGLLEENIYDTGIDCYTDKRYFSHVRSVFTDEKDGRHITLVQMK